MTTLLAAARMAAASSALALLDRLTLLGARGRGLLLPERAEQDVGERPVHRLRHVHRQDEPRGPVERSGDDQQLVVQHEPHRGGGKPGIRIEQRDHRRHVGAADGDDHHHAEDQRYHHDQGEEPGLLRIKDQGGGNAEAQRHEAEVDEILTLVGDRSLRQELLQLAGGHQASRERERPQDDLQGQYAQRETVHPGGLRNIELRRADQRHAEGPEGVAQRRSLGHRCHLHPPQRHADDRPEDQCDRDPTVIDDLVVEQRPTDRQEHAQLAGADAAPGGARRTHPFQGENEQGRGDQVGDFDQVFVGDHCRPVKVSSGCSP